MVSLSNDSGGRGGGYFFGQEVQGNAEDNEELISDGILTASEESNFKPLRTIKAAVLQFTLCVLVEVLTVVFLVFCSPYCKKCPTDAFYIIIYAHIGFWAVLMLIDQYLKHKHHLSHLSGYLDFYRKTKDLRRAPFYIVCTGNTFLLVVTTVIYNCDVKPREGDSLFYSVVALFVVITLEILILLAVIITYIRKVYKFNCRQPFPDVQQDEIMSNGLHSSSVNTDVGYREQNQLEEVLEKQADMIHYLKDHNARLGKKIIALSAQVNNKETA